MIIMQVEAEEFPEVSLKYEVVAVPTFILMKVSYNLRVQMPGPPCWCE